MDPAKRPEHDPALAPLAADLNVSMTPWLRTKDSYPYLTKTEHRFCMGDWVPGDYRFRGFADHEWGRYTIFDEESWVEFHDELRTVGKDFEVHTSARQAHQSKYGLAGPENISWYRIGYADNSSRVEGPRGGDAYCDVVIHTLDWDVVEALHRVAVDSFASKRSLRQVTQDILRAAHDWKQVGAEVGSLWTTMKASLDESR